MKNKITSNQKGLTILEVLIAMLILSASLLLLLNMAMVALDSNDLSNNMTNATQLMQEKLEQVRNIPNLSSAHNGSDSVEGVARSWTVTTAANHLRQIDVSVTWEDALGRTKTNQLSAYVKTDSI